MAHGDSINIGDATLTFIEYPLYSRAHPGEDCEPTERCTMCCIARRHDTGEDVLLWQCEGKNWCVSRHDPEWERHRNEINHSVATDNRMAA